MAFSFQLPICTKISHDHFFIFELLFTNMQTHAKVGLFIFFRFGINRFLLILIFFHSCYFSSQDLLIKFLLPSKT